MKRIFKNAPTIRGEYEYCLFDTDKQIQTRMSFPVSEIQNFVNLFGFVPISPINAQYEGMFNYTNVSLESFDNQ